MSYKSRGAREPRGGDIFHVNSDRKTNGPEREGYTTLMFDRDIVLKNGRHWHGIGANQRPLVKWVDLDLLAASIP